MPDLDPKQFSRELLNAVRKTPRATEKVVRRNSADVKKQAKRNVRLTAPVHNAHAHTAINYDVEAQGVEVVGEVGYDKTKTAGRIGNLLEFGGAGDHSPPHHDLSRALDGQVVQFEGDLADMGEALISGAIEAVLAKMNVTDTE
jgi:hypothetical protein